MALNSKNTLPYLFSVVVGFTIGYGSLIVVLPLYLDSLGATQTQIGTLQTIHTIPSIFLPILAGKLSDKYGRKPVLAIALTGFTLSVFLYPMSQDVLQVILVRAMQGFFSAFWWVSIEAQIADLAPPTRRSHVMGIYNVSWGTGFLLGPVFAGYILENYGFNWTFYLIAAVMGIWIPLVLIKVRTPSFSHTSKPILTLEPIQAPHSSIIWLLPAWITVGTCGGMMGLVFGFYTVYAKTLQVSPFYSGLILSVYGVTRIVAFLGSIIVISRFGERKVLFGGLILITPIALLGLSPRISLHVVAMILVGLGLGLAYTSALTMTSQIPSKQRGFALGIFEVAFASGIAVMGQVGGIIADRQGLHTIYLVGSLVAATVVLILFVFYKLFLPKILINADKASTQKEQTRMKNSP